MTHMGKACDICGDVGFEEDITTCFQCKIAREHCYCMRKVLLTIPEIWFCEECQSSSGVDSPKSVTSEHIPMALTSNDSETESPSWFLKNSKEECHLASTSNAFETASTSSFFKNQVTAGCDGSNLGWPATTATMPKRSLDALSMCYVNRDFRTIGFSKPHGYCSAGFSSITQQNAFQTPREFQDRKTSTCRNEQRIALVPMEKIENSDLPVETIKSPDLKSVDTLPVVCSVKPESMAIVERNLLDIGSGLVKSFPNYPTPYPTWCGSLEILNSVSHSEFFDGFRAHTPGKVHRKVLEFSKQMPEVLSCSLLPGSVVWMDVFHDECPNMEDVALYFLPGSFERSKQQYIRLVGNMEAQDLVLKSCINGVELLIFSSTRLHAELCGSKLCFLWGVCRRLRIPFNDSKSQSKF